MAFICVPWWYTWMSHEFICIPNTDMTHSHVWHDSEKRCVSQWDTHFSWWYTHEWVMYSSASPTQTWLIHTCDMTHEGMSHLHPPPRHIWMSHIWMRSRSEGVTYEWVITYEWVTYEWVISYEWVTYEWVISYEWVTYAWVICIPHSDTYEWVTCTPHSDTYEWVICTPPSDVRIYTPHPSVFLTDLPANTPHHLFICITFDTCVSWVECVYEKRPIIVKPMEIDLYEYEKRPTWAQHLLICITFDTCVSWVKCIYLHASAYTHKCITYPSIKYFTSPSVFLTDLPANTPHHLFICITFDTCVSCVQCVCEKRPIDLWKQTYMNMKRDLHESSTFSSASPLTRVCHVSNVSISTQLHANTSASVFRVWSVWLSHATCERVMSHMWMSHVTVSHVNESCHGSEACDGTLKHTHT